MSCCRRDLDTEVCMPGLCAFLLLFAALCSSSNHPLSPSPPTRFSKGRLPPVNKAGHPMGVKLSPRPFTTHTLPLGTEDLPF
mmetsp:Transcript_110059/g.187329  ORF Transcript_110059/g.187329 Transcript_110059/m.187329 type:complete len:82 (-) Transcript_110059:174-419(-)